MKQGCPWNRAALLPFGKCLWTISGCNGCGDAFGMNAKADISLMDPWNVRQSNDLGETLITVHTDKGKRLLNQIANIKLEYILFDAVRPALDLKDIWRKQQLIPFFRGEKYSGVIYTTGKAEVRQRKFFRILMETLPRMPIIFYRILCRLLPDFRNQILK